ncbi:DUF192 domain-containing protein [Marinivivus vitaminiproducens]|uniref:DUF192 domain-containing protein n=1 Tax=Marinivivus vitaminiproducens TaxID=3035935 RepID=UPI0027AAF8CB|nr:DUF192 domain-containing protein [Geminicoccaceae bacterium SCSIO 64248]
MTRFVSFDLRPLARLLGLLLLILSAGDADAQSGFERSRALLETQSGQHALSVELAVTREQRAQGLMFRRALAPDAGMLFDFGRTGPVGMWMRNTYIPLDMLFLDETGHVTQIASDTEPFSEAVIAADRPVRGVLEVPAGTAARLSVEPGDRLVHPLFGGDPAP